MEVVAFQTFSMQTLTYAQARLSDFLNLLYFFRLFMKKHVNLRLFIFLILIHK